MNRAVSLFRIVGNSIIARSAPAVNSSFWLVVCTAGEAEFGSTSINGFLGYKAIVIATFNINGTTRILCTIFT